MSKDYYSPFKIAHHPERLAKIKAGEVPAPAQVEIILSDLCNQSCQFCAYRWDGYSSNVLFRVIDEETGVVNNNPNRFIPTPKVLEVLDDCAEMGVGAIQYTGGGEPTVHRDHIEIFKETKKRGLGFALVTNGVILRPGALDILPQADWIRVSLDAGTASTYASLRSTPESNFHLALDHIRMLVAAKEAAGSNVVIGVGYTVTKWNWREVYQAVELVSDLGVDNMRISAAFSPEGSAHFDGFIDKVRDLSTEAAAQFSRPDFRIFNRFKDRVQDLQETHPEYEFCGHQYLTTYLGADLNLYRCCVLAYNPRGIIGSIKNQRFRDLWRSEGTKIDFRSLKASSCPACQFNDKNRFINYLVSQDPGHVHYV